jgi:hypothetical protein
MSFGGVAGNLCSMAVMLEIRVFWRCCWRYVSSGGVAGDSCILEGHAKLTDKKLPTV